MAKMWTLTRLPALLTLALGLPFLTSAACAGSTSTTTAETGGSDPCGPGTTPCGGACVSTDSDPAHCGACGQS